MTAIKHIEILVFDFNISLQFYEGLFEIIGWKKVSDNGFKVNEIKVYLKEYPALTKLESLGVRHICFQAESREMVDRVGEYLKMHRARMIRGPLEVNELNYSKGYYTVDFYDPDGLMLEVAHSPESKKI